MAYGQIYNTTWWGNALDTARTAGTEPDFFGSQMKLLTSNQPELVVNGNFATDSDWNKEAGWTISGGKLIANTSSVTACYQVGGATPVVAGKQYKVQFEITDYTNGAVSLRAGTTGAIVNFSTIGVHSTTMVAGGALQIRFASTGVTSLSIDNVSVKEVRLDLDQIEAKKCLADWIHVTALQDLNN